MAIQGVVGCALAPHGVEQPYSEPLVAAEEAVRYSSSACSSANPRTTRRLVSPGRLMFNRKDQ